MKLAIMQPYLFPYIGYFQLINAVDKFVIYDDVNYIKKGWINRNSILVNGKASLFTIPLKEASQNKLINEIFVVTDKKWKVSFLKTIELSYKRAPYFNDVYQLIEDIIEMEEDKLSELIWISIQALNEFIGITTQLVKSSALYQVSDLKGQERILRICKKENASQYINALGGQALYSREYFEKENIQLKFIETNVIEYQQFENTFVSNLSIIDLLMFNSKEQLKGILQKYTLK